MTLNNGSVHRVLMLGSKKKGGRPMQQMKHASYIRSGSGAGSALLTLSSNEFRECAVNVST